MKTTARSRRASASRDGSSSACSSSGRPKNHSEYTRNLGYGAVDALIDGYTNCLITFVGGTMKPRPFDSFKRNEQGRLEPRRVEIDGESYHVAREFMIRLEVEDFSNPERVKKLADAGKLSVEEFRRRFESLVLPRIPTKS